MSDDLLEVPPRGKTPVPLKSRPNLKLFIRQQYADEYLAMGAKFKSGQGPSFNMGVELEHMLCDEAEVLVLKEGDGQKFIKTLSPRDMNALRDVMDELNGLTDKAVEATEKN